MLMSKMWCPVQCSGDLSDLSYQTYLIRPSGLFRKGKPGFFWLQLNDGWVFQPDDTQTKKHQQRQTNIKTNRKKVYLFSLPYFLECIWFLESKMTKGIKHAIFRFSCFDLWYISNLAQVNLISTGLIWFAWLKLVQDERLGATAGITFF